MNRRRALQLGLSATAAALVSPARAQEPFPSRPVRMVIPFGPGGNNDVLGRLTAQKLSDILGRTVVVENRAGADGALAALDVARAKPDGHAILFGGSSTHMITPALMDKPTYDPVTDFAQLAVFAIQPQCLAVSNGFPARSLREFIREVQGNPGKYSYGGVASSLRLGLELLSRRAGGLDMVRVPYKSAPQALQDLFTDRIQVYPSHPVTIANHHREGRLRILAVYSDARLPVLPDIPTATEAGLSGFTHSTFSLYCTTAGTPPAIIDRLYRAIHAAVSDPAFVQVLERDGGIPVTKSDPQHAAAFIREEIARLSPILNTMKS
ncbi:MAG: tripartite tricarboxylate transporter substrate binding protein [Hyphomicrobiales bacterium]|nr:tripartite tricarboxylate transporter substrate binding protein [Hyphomicrobiales bacterium]